MNHRTADADAVCVVPTSMDSDSMAWGVGPDVTTGRTAGFQFQSCDPIVDHAVDLDRRITFYRGK